MLCCAVLRCVLQVYLITELVTGGELLEAVLQRGTYSEAEARLAFVQLLKGIEYLHSKWVAGLGGLKAQVLLCYGASSTCTASG
jgi:serine/threonine protein kinase